jgi:hypothetical protein
MPHRFEERMRLAARYAERYMKQFAAGALEGAARTAAFIIGSFVVTLLVISLLNPEGLLVLEIAGKPLVWCIGVLSSLWLVCRGLLREQHVFYPNDAMRVVKALVIRLPEHWTSQAGSSMVLTKFKQLFAFRIFSLLMEFAGLFLTPWILLFRVRPRVAQILDAMTQHSRYDDVQHYTVGPNTYSAVPPSSAEGVSFSEMEDDVTTAIPEELMRSEMLVPYLQRLESGTVLQEPRELV